MNKQEKAVEFLREAENHLKQTQAPVGSTGIQFMSASIDGNRIDGFPVGLKTSGDGAVVTRVDVQLSRTDIREGLKLIQGIRSELEKTNPDEARIKNAVRFYRDKVTPQVFRTVTSALVFCGLDKVVWY